MKEILDPKNGFFEYSSDDMSRFIPTKLYKDSLLYEFLGRIMAKLIMDRINVDLPLKKYIYKRILQLPCTIRDAKEVDELFYKSLVDLQNLSDEGLIYCELTFVNQLGHELTENGKNIKVTKTNLDDYIYLMLQNKYVSSVREQYTLIREGFYEIIPREKISMFNEAELEMLICGEREFDLEEWKNSTIYYGYTSNDDVIKWFWTVLGEFDTSMRKKVLLFATGSDMVPYAGFKNLKSVFGKGLFSISKPVEKNILLPIAYTCSNQIRLPRYRSYKFLKEYLTYAITECETGFSLYH